MRNFISKYKLSIPQLAKLLDMQITRVVAILDGDKPTEYEGIKLDRLKKFKSFITKPLSIDTIVNEQTKSIESAKKTILKKTRLSHCMTEDIVDYLNNKSGKKFRVIAQTKKLIDVRLKEGFLIDDFYRVIDNQCSKWLSDPKMNDYLRPQTLFGTKFESYLNTTKTKKFDIMDL